MHRTTTTFFVLFVAMSVGCSSKPASQAHSSASEASGPTSTTASTSTEERNTPTQASAADVQKILTQPSQRSDYGTVEYCLKTSDYDRIEVLSRDYLVFSDRQGRNWLNKIKKTCSGLRPKMILHLGVSKGKICVEGMFEGVHNFGGRMETVTAACFLGVFQEVSADQVDAMKAYLKVK